MTRAASVCGAAALAVLAAGCYNSPPPQGAATTTTRAATTTAAPANHLVTQRDIDRYPATSPQHALLAWWRAVQFVDYQGYLQSFVNGFRQTISSDPNSRQALLTLGGLLTVSTVKFLQVQPTGPNGATVYAMISYQVHGPKGKVVTTVLPRAFRLVRQDGKWKLQDDSFVQQVLPPSLRRR